MKNNKKNKIIFVEIIISIILAILICFSINMMAAESSSNTEYCLDSVAGGADLARVASSVEKNNYEVVTTGAGNIFKLNARYNSNGSYGLAVGSGDIDWNSAFCLYHNQTDRDSSVGLRILNIIDIDKEGNVDIYKFVSATQVTYEVTEKPTIVQKDGYQEVTEIVSLVRDAGTDNKYGTDDDKTSNILLKYHRQTLTAENLSAEEMKAFRAFAYLINKTITEEEQYVKLNGAGDNLSERAMDYLWKIKIGNNKKSILEILKTKSTLLHEHFKTYQDESPSPSDDRINEALKAAEQMALEPKLNKVEDNIETPSVTYDDDNNPSKAYIGPLKINYQGGFTSITESITYGDTNNNGTSERDEEEKIVEPIITINGHQASWFYYDAKGKKIEFSEENTEIPVNTEFYAVLELNEETGKELEEAIVKVGMEYFKSLNTRTMLKASMSQGNQNIITYSAKEEIDQLEVTWEIGNTADVKLKKEDTSGKPLAGVKFKLYDSENNQVGNILVTDANGETPVVKINKEEEYTLEEIENKAYGFKKAEITGVEISPVVEGSKVELVDGKVKLTLTEDATIKLSNTSSTKNLTIVKKDDNGEELSGVKFGLWQCVNEYVGYIRVMKEGSFVSEISEEIDITDYNIANVSNINYATKFVTNDQGKIIINNLEQYGSKPTETDTGLYNYILEEIENPNAGYKNKLIKGAELNGESLNVSEDGEITFNLDTEENSLELIIDNLYEFAGIEIIKVNQKYERIPGVKFIIQRGTGKYLQIKKGNVIQSEIDEPITLENGEYTAVYVTTKDEATTFITTKDDETTPNIDEAGKIIINNIETYSSRTSKYSYTAIETDNPNYGYGAVDPARMKKTITLEAGNTKTIIWPNTLGLGTISIEKVDQHDEEIKNVEFIIKRDDGYLQLTKEDGTILEYVDKPVTINKNNKAGGDEYHVEYVEKLENATKFITNDEGIITINNVEIYSGITTKYNYWLKETSNNNHGFKGMIIPEDGVTITGATLQDATPEENGLIDIENREIKFTIDENEAKLKVVNTSQLAPVIIKKINQYGDAVGNVEFIFQINSDKYLQLKTGNLVLREISEPISLLDYDIELVSDREDATIFITNSNGEIIINDCEVNESEILKYTYTAIETDNPNHGYGFGERDFVEEFLGYLEPDTPKIVEILNTRNLSSIYILKTGVANKPLANVEFKIAVKSDDGVTNKYLALYDANGKRKEDITGTAIINENNKANATEYRAVHVSEEALATIFKTDELGRIIIHNVEKYRTTTEEHTYIACEIQNSNYGYGSKINIKQSKVTLNRMIRFYNISQFSNIAIDELGKHDEHYENIKLPGVGFALRVKTSTFTGYVSLYNASGNIVEKAYGETTIDKIPTDESEYIVKYYENSKEYSELTEEEKANITMFVTGEEGELKVNNLEVWEQHHTGEKYIYDLIEVYNPYFGYDADLKIEDIETSPNKTVELYAPNEQKGVQISGYVWVENPTGKSNQYNSLYNQDSEDIKLTDLYNVDSQGNVTLNTEANIPIQIMLRDKTTGKIVKNQPDKFDTQTGEYLFEVLLDVPENEYKKAIELLKDYEVAFVYDGFYYTTVVSNVAEDNGSKAEEVPLERTELNNLFGTIQEDNKVVSAQGNTNTVDYIKEGHESNVSKLNFDTTITATTSETDYNLYDVLHNLKSEATTSIEIIENVNMGLVLREQPKISIGSDIQNVYVEVNGKQYTYEYATRSQYDGEENRDEVGVKFEKENSTSGYTQTIYSSDIKALEAGNATMGVSIVYKIQLSNKSTTLTSVVNEIANYYDKRYVEVISGSSLDEVNRVQGAISSNYKILQTDENINIEGAGEVYNCARIKLGDGISLAAGESKNIYIKFILNQDAIKDLLDKKSTYHNATEIMSYSTKYGANTNTTANSENERIRFASDEIAEGSIYAGIDQASQPGNIELKLKDHVTEEATIKILDNTNFEDDTTSSPSLILEISEARMISGKVWGDSISYTENNEKLGNGKLEQGENGIANVKVELWEVDNNGKPITIAKYSNDAEVRTITGKDGTYKFGEYITREDGKIDECYGIVPGKRYVIKYTYTDESYIVDADGNKNYLNINDYKSTIITSEIIKNAFNGQNEKWYLVEEKDANGNVISYSDARDNINLRPEYNNPDVTTITNSTYNSALGIESMEAYTPIMYIGVEFTETDRADAISTNFVQEFKQVDFGIVERPDVDMEIEKEITALGITAQNGTNIIPIGDPSDAETIMQYVKTGLEGIVPVEIDMKLLQSANLNLEYTITLKNNSDVDYLNANYYYYGPGENGENRTNPNTANALKVVDYLDSTLTLDETRNTEGIWSNELTVNDLTGLISTDVRKHLTENGDNYRILTTTAFANVTTGNEKSIKLYATKSLASTTELTERNRVEIIEISGRRPVKGSTPGNYIPSELPSERDEAKVDLSITPPTGTTTNYVPYIIATAATLTILVLGIVIIKKKIVK